MKHMIRVIGAGLIACMLMPVGGVAVAADATLLEQGIAEYRAENFEEALNILETARKEQPASSLVAFYLGMARKQSGDLNGAIKDLNDACTLKPPVLDAFIELADAYHVSGNQEQALAWVAQAEGVLVKPAQVAFLKGQILAASERRGEAIQSFERAKRLDAGLAQAADMQIAINLAGDRKLNRARDALRAVIATDPTSEIASYAKEYEQAFSRIIESYRPLRLTVGLSYLYDDNAISNPSDATARTLIGNPSGQTDHAFVGSLRLDYNPMLSGAGIFSAQYLLHNTQYGNTDTSDENPSTIINSLTLIPGIALGTSALSLPVNYTHVLLKEEKYQQTVTARPTWSLQLAPQHILQAAFSYTRREMLKEPLVGDENRDAHIFGGSAGYIFTYGDQGGMAGLRYDYSYDDAEGVNWINRGHRVSLNGVVPLTPRLKLNLSGDVTLQDYLYANTLFGVRRDDTIWLGSVGLTWNVTPDIALNAQYAHTTAQSNIEVYDYTRNTVTAGVELSF